MIGTSVEVNLNLGFHFHLIYFLLFLCVLQHFPSPNLTKNRGPSFRINLTLITINFRIQYLLSIGKVHLLKITRL